MKKFVVFVSILVFLSGSLLAQIYPNRNFTVKDGLINSNVFSIDQDEDGYIWFGTENGLSKFDGIEFVNYPLEQMEINSYISTVNCYGKDQIYFGTGNGGIYSLDQILGKAKKVNKGNISESNEIVFLNDTIISLHEKSNLDILSLRNGLSHQPDQMIESDPENKSYSILKHSSGKIFIGRRSGLYEFNSNGQLKILGVDIPVYFIKEKGNGDLLLGSKDSIYVYSNNHLISLSISIIPEGHWIRNILIDKNENIWFNPWGSKDIFMYSNGNIINVSEVAGIKSTSVTRIFEDRDGNIWVGTIGKGVFMFSNLNSTIYPASITLPAADIKDILTAPDGMLLGTNDGLAFLDSVTGRIDYFKNLKTKEYVKGIEQIGDREYVVAVTDVNVNLKTTYYDSVRNISFRYCQGSSLTRAGDTLLVGIWDNYYLSYSLFSFELIHSECDLFPDNFNKVRINATLRDHRNTTWIGGQKGLVIIDSLGNRRNFEIFEKNENVISITDQNNEKIAVVTNSGFAIYQNNKFISDIREIERVRIPQTTEVCFIDDDEYIAGTLNGIIYHRNGKQIVLSIHHGIWSENVNCIFYNPGWKDVYIGTTEGLVKVSLAGLRKSLDELLSIHYLAVLHNNKIYKNILSALSFEYSQNPFTIITKSFVYQNPRSISYQYRHNCGAWIDYFSGELYFAALEPGVHVVEVRASKDPGNWGDVTKVIIEIIPPFYRTIWFYVIIITTFLIAVFFVFRKLFQIRRRKHEESMNTKQMLVELQQKALASNLNPHFVFNSLNSIQHFINKSNLEEANNYLVKFSKLMRMQLNMADLSFISLDEEINRLESYLSLEQMRFGNKLVWSISVEGEINRYQLKIPNMILQPFVENSIWHGIMPMKTPGEVRISFRILDTDELEIIISDNGVGFNQILKPTDSTHKSRGIQLITDRLALLDPGKKDCISFSSSSTGTVVKIILTTTMYNYTSSEKLEV